jgi:DNA-binding response OmpR family regulator
VTGGSETVLVVEDEEAVRSLIRHVLERHGYRVLEAPDGEAAQSLFARDPAAIALLVTDIVMPRMSGVDLARRLVEQRPGLRILYLSGYTENSVASHGLPRGTAFLGKPFSPAELARRVREVLDVEPDVGD